MKRPLSTHRFRHSIGPKRLFQSTSVGVRADRDKHPEWKGERTKMVCAFPTHEKLWHQYAEFRAECAPATALAVRPNGHPHRRCVGVSVVRVSGEAAHEDLLEPEGNFPAAFADGDGVFL